MSLETFYKALEGIDTFDPWRLRDQVYPIAGHLCPSDETNLKTESKILSFVLKEGRLNSSIESTNIKGNVKGYPSNDNFTKKETDYIITRLTSVNNPWIKSRYSQIIWELTKNNKYAKTAIESYLHIIEKLSNKPKNESFQDFASLIKAIVHIGEKSKQSIELIKENVVSLLLSDNLPFYIKAEILNISLNSRMFKPKDLEFILDEIPQWICLDDLGSFFTNQDILELAIQLSNKTQNSPSGFYLLKAENFDLIINHHPDEEDFIRFESIGEKAKCYKRAGDSVKHQDALKEYNYLKKKLKLNHISIILPDNETQLLNNYLNEKAEHILRMSTEGILTYFLKSEYSLISNKILENISESNFKNSLRNIFSVTTIDINSNHKNLTEKDKLDLERFQTYNVVFNTSVLPLIRKVFAAGILSRKINYYSVFQFLKENSWYAQNLPDNTNNRDIYESSNWLSLLAPGLHNYFTHTEWAVITDNKNSINYILSIDSLSLKFEGALRNFIRLIGGTTTIEKRGKLQEQTLEELLKTETLKIYFSEEDLTLFNYVFTNKGWNLRNNVAHSFYPYSSYSFEKASVVFICILKLGGYKFKIKTE